MLWDVDQDGMLDIISCGKGVTCLVQRNTGARQFSSLPTPSLSTAASASSAGAMLDIEGDGEWELIQTADEGLFIFTDLAVSTRSSTFVPADRYSELVRADMNNDGTDELVAASPSGVP